MAFIFGIPLNTFILAISLKELRKRQYQSPVDLILFALGLFNIIMQSAQLLTSITYYLFTDIYMSYSFNFMDSIFAGTTLSVSWITAWLCTYYCIKILHFQHHLLLYLKWTFPNLLLKLLVGSIVLSYSLVSLMLGFIVRYVTANQQANSTTIHPEELLRAQKKILYIYGLNFAICWPLLLILLSLGLTIISLMLHALSGPSVHLKALCNAAKTMSLLMVLQILYYVSQLCLTLNVGYETIFFWIFLLILYFFYPLQAVTLILGNRKLHSAYGAFCCLNKT
ncbi:taste receptor type 2 member 41-like [Bombina bombina]|uniref:taste receptor type 2 member 41-like n=1 Tax=Bombina bombina TaxID=8345 RepID=UPI00235AFB25|nr:taste receptor type 2 member 41-like [Bombina bombina]